jgi:enoyl-CoA hydratase/carnithine racemase
MTVQIENPSPHIAILRLCDPGGKNPITPELVEAFPRAVEGLKGKEEVRVVIVAGNERFFSVGADFRTIPTLMERFHGKVPDSEVESRAIEALYESFFTLETLPQPTIAAIAGSAVGGGLGIALLCDLRIASLDAKLGANFSRLGIHPGMGISYRLVQLLGEERAAEWLYTGRIFTGEEAEKAGLILKAVPREEVEREALHLAEEIASNAPLSLRAIRETLLRIRRGAAREEILRRESQEQSRLSKTYDAMEGISAMMAKRAPRFEGR